MTLVQMYDRIKEYRNEFAIMLANGASKESIAKCCAEMFEDSCGGFEDRVIIENLREVYQQYQMAVA